jgi:hypothetical protein
MSVITYFGGSRKLKTKQKEIQKKKFVKQILEENKKKYINEKNIPERPVNSQILVEKDQNI